MLSKKKLSALLFAEKIDAIYPLGKICVLQTNFTFNVSRIPILEIQKQNHFMKEMVKFQVEELKDKRITLLAVAHQTSKLREKQNLHLYQLNKNYCEKKMPLKKVKDWKFPQKSFIEKRIFSNDTMGEKTREKKQRHVTLLFKIK
jgi:hypothetical protein